MTESFSIRFESPSSPSGQLRIPGSKSYTHRAYLMSALLEGGCIDHPLRSEDTEATRACLPDFSASVTNHDQRVVIERGSRPATLTADRLNAGESGTLFRFLIPICSVLEGPDEVVIDAEGTLLDRDHGEVIEGMKRNGFEIESVGEKHRAPVRCYPGQTVGDQSISLSAETTSQHVSGWLIALASQSGGSVHVTSELVSSPYVDMTTSVLESADVDVTVEEGPTFRIDPRNASRLDYDVPGDYSSAAFFLVAAALTESEITLRGLKNNDLQADRRILTILKKLGARYRWSGDRLTQLPPDTVPGFTVDASQCPDLVPVLVVLGSFANKKVVIENINHLTNKESDRINIPCEELQGIGVDAQPYSDRIEIDPTVDGYEGGSLDAHNDHRLAMAFSVFGTVNGNVTVEGAECVAKSYPGFFDDLGELNVDFDRESN